EIEGIVPISRKRLLPLAVVLLVVGAVVWGFRPQPVEVDLAPIERGPLRVTVDEDGRTRVRERYVVAAPLAGRLRRVDLDAGDSVQRGSTVVAIIEPADPNPLDARARAETEARLRAAEASRKRAGAERERARAAHALAESDLRRARELSTSNVLSKQELDRTVERERAAAEESRAAAFAVDVATFEADQARAALLHGRGDQTPGGGFAIAAPVDGRVLRVLQESSRVVEAGTPLVEIGDPTDLEAEIDVLSSDAVRIQQGAPVLLEHWGGPRPLRGRVRIVEPGGFTKVSALGVEEQRVNVIVTIDEPVEERSSLGDGYRVEARIVVWEGDQVLKVPTGALFRRSDDWAVFTAAGGRARLRKIAIGERSSLEAEVRDGVAEGESVVLHPSDRVADGVTIAAR
ncbi:MAG: efflux RND transporter periplasmic adaptor subunit, partial [Candidatus Binatia bacterium]